MDSILWLLLGILIGAIIGACVVALLNARGRSVNEDSSALRRERDLLRDGSGELREQLDDQRTRREEAEQRLAALQERVEGDRARIEEQKELLSELRVQLAETFAMTGKKALDANNRSFLELASENFKVLLAEAKGESNKQKQSIDTLIKPLKELLEKQQKSVQELETKREGAYRGLEETIKQVARSHETLSKETGRLVTALQKPQQRGRWGELQLRNAVELAGMIEHCDFAEQQHVQGEDGALRPDMVVNLPGEGIIVVDSKVSLSAYLESTEPDADRADRLRAHVESMRRHAKELSSKKYWEQFTNTPKLVVMFMPIESALMAALEIEPDLHSDAMANHVLITTPTLLVALLRSIAYGWQQEAVAENARRIASVGNELHDRIGVFLEHYESLGRRLRGATESYNQSIGSLERRVLVSTRKLRELQATTDAELESPEPIEDDVRRLASRDMDLLEGTDQ